MAYKHGASFSAGLLTGGVLGAAWVLLLAQRTGEEIRSQIRDKGTELEEKARTAYARVREKLQATVADLRTRLGKETYKLSQENGKKNNVPNR